MKTLTDAEAIEASKVNVRDRCHAPRPDGFDALTCSLPMDHDGEHISVKVVRRTPEQILAMMPPTWRVLARWPQVRSTAPVRSPIATASGAKAPPVVARTARRGSKSRKATVPESAVLKAIMQWLELQRDVFAERCNTGVAMLPGKGGEMRPVTFGTKGGPDIRLTIAVGAGTGVAVPCAIEAKSSIGKQSDDQKEWQRRFERVGGRYAVCRSLSEAVAFVEAVRLMPRTKTLRIEVPIDDAGNNAEVVGELTRYLNARITEGQSAGGIAMSTVHRALMEAIQRGGA